MPFKCITCNKKAIIYMKHKYYIAKIITKINGTICKSINNMAPVKKSVYEYNQVNTDENVTNTIAVVFLDQARCINRRAQITLLNSLLKEQVFN